MISTNCNLMRYACELHMSVVLFNHGNTGAQVLGKGVHSHPVVGQHHGGIVMAQAVPGALLAASGVVQEI